MLHRLIAVQRVHTRRVACILLLPCPPQNTRPPRYPTAPSLQGNLKRYLHPICTKKQLKARASYQRAFDPPTTPRAATPFTSEHKRVTKHVQGWLVHPPTSLVTRLIFPYLPLHTTLADINIGGPDLRRVACRPLGPLRPLGHPASTANTTATATQSIEIPRNASL